MFYKKRRRQKEALVLLGGILAREYDNSRPFRRHFQKIGMDKTIFSIMQRATMERANWFVRVYRWVKSKTLRKK